ncbi:MAG TPA: hypothetical protein VLD67_07550, partial [Vicinamibacterales bacterium]|nr:hypothetical protein [Vicinamibacterales bacterium]
MEPWPTQVAARPGHAHVDRTRALEHRRVPRQLDVDASARRALQVQADPAGVRREQDTTRRVVVKLDDVLRPSLLPLLPGEERRLYALASELVARGPVRQSQHPSPLAEHDDLACLCERELADQLAQFQQLRTCQASEGGLRGSLDPREVWPDVLEAQLRQAVGDDPLGGEERHQAQELGLGQRTPAGAPEELRDGHVERVVLFHLLGGHLDRDPGIRPRRQLGQHLGTDAPDHAAGETGPQRVEVPGAADSRLPSTGVVCHGARRHFGSSARSSTHSTIDTSSS